jgi:hypothetical protein
MRTAILCAGVFLAACGGGGGYDGGGGGGSGGGSMYTVGGTVSGLTGTVVLQNNGTDNLSISADGPFTFSTRLGMGATYNVIVRTQPMGKTCTVANGSGSIGDAYTGANVTDVMVTCI